MAKDNDNRHNTKQIDFSAKSLGKIKRVQPESMSDNNGSKTVKTSRAVKSKQNNKANNDNKRQKKPTNKATRAVSDNRRNDDYLSGADSNTFGVISKYHLIFLHSSNSNLKFFIFRCEFF